MPMNITPAKTTKGHLYLRMVSSGDVTAADADKLNKMIAPGAQYANTPILGMVEPGATFSPEARQAFTRGNAPSPDGAPVAPVAVVVNSAPLRVMLSFIIRMTGATSATRFFPAEAEALAWLEEKLGGA